MLRNEYESNRRPIEIDERTVELCDINVGESYLMLKPYSSENGVKAISTCLRVVFSSVKLDMKGVN